VQSNIKGLIAPGLIRFENFVCFFEGLFISAFSHTADN